MTDAGRTTGRSGRNFGLALRSTRVEAIGLVAVSCVVLGLGGCQASAGASASTTTSAQTAAAGARAPEPRRASTPDECRACDGVWGKHGLLQEDRCLCRTRDAGKRCRDGLECEGDCLGDGTTETVEPGPPPKGYFLGRCSELVTTFGCRAFILDGAAKDGPVRLDEPQPQLCID